MTGRLRAITPAVMRVFDLLEEAAVQGARCPSNDLLAARLGASVGWAAEAVQMLEQGGLIRVWRYNCRRVVRIVATGKQTAGDTSAPQRVYGPGSRGPTGGRKQTRENPPPLSIQPAADQAPEPSPGGACTAPPAPRNPPSAGLAAPAGPLSPVETVAQAIVRGADDAVVVEGKVVRQPVGMGLRNLRGAITRHSQPAAPKLAPAGQTRPPPPPRTCQWPLWRDDAPRPERRRFCGDDPAYPGCSYCERHRLQARGVGTPTERRAEKILLAHAGG